MLGMVPTPASAAEAVHMNGGGGGGGGAAPQYDQAPPPAYQSQPQPAGYHGQQAGAPYGGGGPPAAPHQPYASQAPPVQPGGYGGLPDYGQVRRKCVLWGKGLLLGFEAPMFPSSTRACASCRPCRRRKALSL